MDTGNGFYTVEELRKRLSISTLVFWEYRPIGQSSLEELARRGIRSIELLESPEQFDMADARSMRFIGEVCRSCGIEVVAYHAHKTNFSDLDTEAKRIARVDFCRRQIDTMLDLGGKLWGCHAHIMDATLIQCYEELARHVEGTGAVVTVENFTGEGMWVEDRMAFLDKIDHPQVGMILDIGHVRDREGTNPMTLPGGPTQVLELCGRHLRHVHLHGFKDGVDHFPPFVEGDTIRWAELFRMLRTIGYPGAINFEPSGEPHHHNTLQAVALAPERIVEMETQSRVQTESAEVVTPD
jgi:sugar phosphate isomerase/epimerase